ncbi:MAG: Fe-S cluster assembly protein SufD [Odoribacter sp.]
MDQRGDKRDLINEQTNERIESMELEKINTDFETLFKDGRSLLNMGCGAVMNGCREEAYRKFTELGGIPYKKEDYIYMDLLSLLGRDYNVVLKYIRQDVDINEAFRCAVTDLVTHPVLTLNGWWFDGNIEPEIPEEVVVCGLREASIKYPDLFHRHYNQYAPAAHKDGLVALNTMFAQDGVFIYIPDGVVLERPLQIINLLRAKADLMGFQRNLIILGKDARATLLVCDHTLSDHYFLMNNTTEVSLEDNAQLDYYQVQNQHLGASQINSVFVSERNHSVFDSNIVTLYGGVIRNNLYVALNEEGGECHLYGMYILDKRQIVDNFSYIDHIAPHCNSNEHYKGVMDDNSLTNFCGCIRVRPDAQKTEAYQANDNLLLSDTARVNTKPQLIIDADDVKCSHGATVGQIDEEAMFYLRSRGIGREEARMMMMFGFAHDIIRRVKLEPLRVKIDELVDKRLRGELSKCYNCVMQCKK